MELTCQACQQKFTISNDFVCHVLLDYKTKYTLIPFCNKRNEVNYQLKDGTIITPSVCNYYKDFVYLYGYKSKQFQQQYMHHFAKYYYKSEKKKIPHPPQEPINNNRRVIRTKRNPEQDQYNNNNNNIQGTSPIISIPVYRNNNDLKLRTSTPVNDNDDDLDFLNLSSIHADDDDDDNVPPQPKLRINNNNTYIVRPHNSIQPGFRYNKINVKPDPSFNPKLGRPITPPKWLVPKDKLLLRRTALQPIKKN